MKFFILIKCYLFKLVIVYLCIFKRDPDLVDYMAGILRSCALELDTAEMIRYEPSTGQLASTDRGRTASLFYICYKTALMVKETFESNMLMPAIFNLLSNSFEFSQMKVCDVFYFDYF